MNSVHTRRVIAALCASLALLVLPGCGGESEADLIASAKSYLEKKDSKAAIIQLKTLLQKNPKSGEARFLLGDALLKSGDAAAAAVELEKARDLGHGDDEVLPELARALMATGQAKKVTELYGRVTLKDPKAASDLKATVAAAYGAQGQIERSEAVVETALQLDPKNGTARLLQARLTAGRGDFDKALMLIDALLGDEPRRREAWHLKGEVLWVGKGDPDGAVKAFRETLASDPRYMPAHSSLIAVLLGKRDIDGFRTQVAELKKALPGNPETRFYETQIAFIDKDYTRAREGAQQLLKVAPENVRVLQLAGAIEMQSGSLVLAESHLSKALGLAPNSGLARRALAEVYVRAGQPAKAVQTLQPFLDGGKASGDVLALVAEAHLQNGDAAKAETYFLQAAKANPDDPKVRTALALSQIGKGNVEAGFAQLESVAAADKSAYADLALVSARLRRNDLDGALKDVERLQAKLPDKPLPHFLRGRILAQRKDGAGARASFEKALAADPSYFPAVSSLASLDLADKQPEAARKRFDDLLARDPKNYQALLAVAELRQRAGAAPAEVGALLAEAVKLNPTEVAPRIALIQHQLAQKDLKAALATAQDGVAAVPDNFTLLDALGRTQLLAGETQQSISTFGKLAAAQPLSPQPHLRLAEVYVQTKDFPAAARSLRKALELSPKLVVAQRGLAQIAMADKRPDDAVTVAREVQKQRPNEPVGYLLEGEVHASQKRWDPAIAAFRSAWERNKSTEMTMRLHAMYTLGGKTAEADRFAAAWEKDHPKDFVFQAHLGAMAMDKRDWAQGEARYRNVLALRAEDPIALNNVAWLMQQQGKPGSLTYAEKANQLLPDRPSIMDTLASALAAENQLPKAVEWQRKAVGKAPDAPGYRLNLAKLLVKSGDKAGARAELDTLAKLGDKFAGQAEVSALLKTL